MTHLTPDELVDAVDDSLAPEHRGHLEQCERCRTAAADFARLLGEARRVDVPEPSPLFWDQFSMRVREAIRSEASTSSVWTPDWFRWPVLVPIAVLVLLVASLAMVIPLGLKPADRHASGSVAPVVPLDEPAAGDDIPWTFVVAVMAGLDIDEAERAGFAIAPGAAERAVAALDPAERRELLRLLEAELARPKS